MTGTSPRSWDVVVVGAGCFGAWTAWQLRAAGRSVLLVDQYGPANARASSGGESRAIRMSYGPDELYTRFSQRSLGLWQSLFKEIGRPELFQRTGVLWMAKGETPDTAASLRALRAAGIPHERLGESELRRRYPQIVVVDGGSAILEPESGVLMARRAVQAVVADAVRRGVDYEVAKIEPQSRNAFPCRSNGRFGEPSQLAPIDEGLEDVLLHVEITVVDR